MIGLGVRMHKATPLLVKIQLRMQQSAALANPWCVSILTREIAPNKTRTKPKGLCIGTCALFVLRKTGKSFQHTEANCRIKQKSKNEQAFA